MAAGAFESRARYIGLLRMQHAFHRDIAPLYRDRALRDLLPGLGDLGRLVLAGPLPRIDASDPGPAGFAGSLIVAEFASLEQAQAWAQADPFRAAGVYRQVEVHPFKQVLP